MRVLGIDGGQRREERHMEAGGREILTNIRTVFGGFRGMGKSTPDSARGGSLESEAKKGGVAPASLPLLKIWDITHPVGMVGNPACVPSGMRFAPLLNRFSNGSQAVRLAVRMKSKRKTGSGHLCGSPSGSQPNLY